MAADRIAENRFREMTRIPSVFLRAEAGKPVIEKGLYGAGANSESQPFCIALSIDSTRPLAAQVP